MGIFKSSFFTRGEQSSPGESRASEEAPKEGNNHIAENSDSNTESHEYEINGEFVDSKREKEVLETIGAMGDDESVSDAGYAKFSRLDIQAIIPGTPDDDDLPVSTLRMWFLSLAFGAVVSGVDAFFSMRFPTISISTVVIIMVTWPLGKLWEYIVPNWTLRLPRGMSISLNPGPFNYKEHGCIFLFTNLMTSAGLVNNLIIEDTKFFKVRTGIGRQILINISMYMISFSIMGLAREILVTPEDRVWPGMLSRIALFKTFHTNDNPVANHWKMSRWVFFVLVFLGSFVWYWVPDLLMPFVSDLGAWISWIKPNSATLSQVFGVKTGLGIFPLTLDWTQVSSINNPLTTPFWAVATMFISFVFWIWIVMPGLYYQNHWNVAHLPIMTNGVYTVDRKKYSFQKVADKNWNLDLEKFKKYSPAILPIAFLMHLALGIAVFAALVVHFTLLFYDEVIVPWKNRSIHDDPFNKAMKRYSSPSLYWYLLTLAIGLGLGFAFSEGWDDAPIRADGFIVSVIIGVILYIPISLVEARANANLTIDMFFYIVGANWFKGNPLRVLYFYSIGYGIIQHGMHSAQSAKVGHYLRISPRIYMAVLFVSGIWASLVSPSVCWYLLTSGRFPDICTPNAKNNMVCRKQQTQFNTQGIWGLFGSHIFAPGGRYVWIMWFFLVGAAVPIAHFAYMKWRPRSKLSMFDPILFLAGGAQVPSVTGFNVSTWFVAAFVFNFAIHRRFTAWWRKYNLVTAVGLDCGVAITAILVYFAIVYTGANKPLTKWWGAEVSKKGCDAKGCGYLGGDIPRPTGF